MMAGFRSSLVAAVVLCWLGSSPTRAQTARHRQIADLTPIMETPAVHAGTLVRAATWCKNRVAMDDTTLSDPAVVDATASLVKIKCQAEDPDEPLARDVLRRFGAVGFPTYVVLRPAP